MGSILTDLLMDVKCWLAISAVNLETSKLTVDMWLIIILFFVKHPIIAFNGLYYSWQSDRWFKRQLGEMLYGNGSYCYLKWKRYKAKSEKWNALAEPFIKKYLNYN